MLSLCVRTSYLNVSSPTSLLEMASPSINKTGGRSECAVSCEMSTADNFAIVLTGNRDIHAEGTPTVNSQCYN